MPMKNPVHPGALAKANLNELNLSVAAAAKTMKITRQQQRDAGQKRRHVCDGAALCKGIRRQRRHVVANAGCVSPCPGTKEPTQNEYPASGRASVALKHGAHSYCKTEGLKLDYATSSQDKRSPKRAPQLGTTRTKLKVPSIRRLKYLHF
jgi:hypothetical protein